MIRDCTSVDEYSELEAIAGDDDAATEGSGGTTVLFNTSYLTINISEEPFDVIEKFPKVMF